MLRTRVVNLLSLVGPWWGEGRDKDLEAWEAGQWVVTNQNGPKQERAVAGTGKTWRRIRRSGVSPKVQRSKVKGEFCWTPHCRAGWLQFFSLILGILIPSRRQAGSQRAVGTEAATPGYSFPCPHPRATAGKMPRASWVGRVPIAVWSCRTNGPDRTGLPSNGMEAPPCLM